MIAKKRVLIVDDEEEFLSMLKEALSLRGLDVATANNGVAAGMEISSQAPDLVLMDLNMPGINGLQACEALKRNPLTKNIPLIVVSAMSDEQNIKKAYKIGVLDYFIKPVNIEELVKRLKEVLAVN